MAKKKSSGSGRNKPTNINRIVQGEYKVPYFEFKTDGYAGIAAIVTDDNGDIGNGIEAARIPELINKNACDRLYRNNSHYGYDITLVGVKKSNESVVERMIGEFMFMGDYAQKGLTGQHAPRLFNGANELSQKGKSMLGGIVALVEANPDEYLMAKRQAD